MLCFCWLLRNQKYLSIHALDQFVQLFCNMKLVRHSGTRDRSSPSSSSNLDVCVCLFVCVYMWAFFTIFTMFNVSNLMVIRTIIDFTIGIRYNVIEFYNWNLGNIIWTYTMNNIFSVFLLFLFVFRFTRLFGKIELIQFEFVLFFFLSYLVLL